MSGERLKFDFKRFLWDIGFDIAGSVIFSLGLNCFLAPNNIAPGGVSGVAVIVNHLIGLPIGTVSFLINVPLILLALKFLGKEFTLNTLKSVLIFSVFLDLGAAVLPVYQGDLLLSSLFGGVGMGIGLALVFMRGSTTGGTDIVSRLVQLRFPHMPVGRLMFIVDLGVLLASALVFWEIDIVLYGLIAIFTSSKLIDSILYGVEVRKLLMIISENSGQIAKSVMDELERGATFLKGMGAYSSEDKNVLLCAVSRQEFYRVKKIVRMVDPNAFLIVMDAQEVIGEGFKSIHK